MAKLEDVLKDAYRSAQKSKIEAVVGSAKDALESYGGRGQDLGAVVAVLFDALDQQTDSDVIEWTLEALLGATFHPDFPTTDLGRLVMFLERTGGTWLEMGLEILAYSTDLRYADFLRSLLDHPDPKIAANAAEALDQIQKSNHIVLDDPLNAESGDPVGDPESR